MNIIPIVSSLRRHRIAASLLVFEIALTCAIVANAVFLISERLTAMDKSSGVAESELVWLQASGVGGSADTDALTRQDLAALRAIPYLKGVAVVNQMPFGDSSWNSELRTTSDSSIPGVNVSTYVGTEDLVETYGLKLVAGRDFEPTEYLDLKVLDETEAQPSAVIMARPLADHLFPGEDAVGKSVYIWGDDPVRVVGVVETLVRPSGSYQHGADSSVILPGRPAYDRGVYMMRVDPSDRDRALADAKKALEGVDATRLFNDSDWFENTRSNFFRGDRAMAWLLVTVCIALMLITALGIVGLASFWVQQRTQQIGVRRALGATRGQILRHFQTENFVLATMGIALGMLLAFGVNALLMKHYEIARLPALYLPVGAVLLYGLCQLAVLGPALRASRVAPAVATRGV